MVLDRSGFFQGDIITRDELIQGLFDNSPNIFSILNNDCKYQLLNIFKESYQSTDIIDSLEEYDVSRLNYLTWNIIVGIVINRQLNVKMLMVRELCSGMEIMNLLKVIIY